MLLSRLQADKSCDKIQQETKKNKRIFLFHITPTQQLGEKINC